MSGFYSDDGCWTEHEIAIGLPSMMALGYWPGDNPDDNDISEVNSSLSHQLSYTAIAFQMELSKAIYPLRNKSDVQKKTVRKLLQYGSNIAIWRYGQAESLPRRYQLLTKNAECIMFLLHDFFLRVEKIALTLELNNRITFIVNELKKKDESKIAYQRIGELRQFICREVDLAKGIGQSSLCDREEMRLLLSTARLHLCLNELIKHYTFDITSLQKRYISAVAIEAALPSSNPQTGKKNIFRWRLRHLRSLLYYFPLEIRQIIMDFMQNNNMFSDYEISLIDYKESLIKHCGKCVERHLTSRRKLKTKSKRKTKEQSKDTNNASDMWDIPF